MFFARCYVWGATSDYLFKIGDIAPTGAGWPNISRRRGRPPPTNYSYSQKTRLNVLSYGVKIWTDLSTVSSQFTRVTDGRTGGRTEFSSLDPVCIPCSAVKTYGSALLVIVIVLLLMTPSVDDSHLASLLRWVKPWTSSKKTWKM